MTDEEFKNLVAKCESEGLDHALAWHFSIGNKHPGDKVLVMSMGLKDEFGGLEGVPADLYTDEIVARLEAAG